MRIVLVWLALLTSPLLARADCRALLEAGRTALAVLEADLAETSLREAEKQCSSQESAALLAGLLYDRSLIGREALRPKLLREARSLIEEALTRGPATSDLLTIRAAIAGDLAQVSSSSTEQARLLLAVHADASRALAMDANASMPLVVLGAWHRNAAALGFKERLFVKMVAGTLPDASLEESRRLLDRAVSRDRNPVTLFFLGATMFEQGEKRSARETFATCARTEPNSLRESFIRQWCRDRVAPR